MLGKPSAHLVSSLQLRICPWVLCPCFLLCLLHSVSLGFWLAGWLAGWQAGRQAECTAYRGTTSASLLSTKGGSEMPLRPSPVASSALHPHAASGSVTRVPPRWVAELILTWQGRHHDHEGGSPRARLDHCTLAVLTLANSPNAGISTA